MKADDPGTALVTGAAGFAGRHLIAELERSTSWGVIGLTRTQTKINSRVRMVTCDLRDADHVARVLNRYRPEIIFHLAAQSYVPKAVADPSATISNNVFSQLNVLEAVRTLETNSRVIVVSSSEIYGAVAESELPLGESAAFRPGNPYAVSKATQDLLGYQYSVSHGMDIVRARPFNHSGPGQSDRFVISGFARQIAEAEAGIVEPTILVGNLNAQRDFLDVRDVVRAYIALAIDGESGDVYNIASEIPRRIGDLLDMLLRRSSLKLSVKHDPSRARLADVPIVYGSSAKIRQTTEWNPMYDIQQTIDDTLNNWRKLA